MKKYITTVMLLELCVMSSLYWFRDKPATKGTVIWVGLTVLMAILYKDEK